MTMQTIDQRRLAWLALGILIGFLLTAIMPARPLHAVATDGAEGFSLATGQIDPDVEGVFFLDGLTGDLRGAVLNLSNGKFTTLFETNVMQDLQGLQVDVARGAKFLMVTGGVNLRQGASQVQPGEAAVYVAEVNSGVCLAYGVPWNRGRVTQANQQVQRARLVLLDIVKFRTVAIRPQ